MTVHQLGIQLDEDRYQRVLREAGRRGVSVDTVIGEAIDRLAPSLDQRRAAAAAILAAEPMPVPADPTELRRELDVAHDRVRE